jgi:hypothetical protein
MPTYTLRINGRTHEVDGEPADSLLSVLRYDLGLTGSKFGCGEGYCGACTVLVDNQVVRSCTARLAAVAGKPITTIEGITDSASGAERASGPAARRELGGVQGPRHSIVIGCIRFRKPSSKPRRSSVATARPEW